MPPRVQKIVEIVTGPNRWTAHVGYIIPLIITISAGILTYVRSDAATAGDIKRIDAEIVNIHTEMARDRVEMLDHFATLQREIEIYNNATAETLKRMGEERRALIEASAREKEGLHTDIRTLAAQFAACKVCK